MKFIIERYIKEIIPTKGAKTQYENGLMLKWLRPVFDDAPINAITPAHIAKYRDRRGATAPVRANREIALFSHTWNMAREWGYTEKKNPVKGVPKNKENARHFYAGDDVWSALRESAVPELCLAMDLTYLTGQRPADVREMRITDIQYGHLAVDQNKTGKKLLIAVTGHLEALIAQRKSIAVINPFVVVTSMGKHVSKQMLRDRWDDARILAAEKNPEIAERIKAFQFRHIRPKAASEIDVEHPQNRLGHTNKRITMEVYRRASEKVAPTK